MKKVDSLDKTTIISILSDAFKDNHSVNFVARNDIKRAARIQALMDYAFEVCTMFGEAWLTDDKRGCALILYPHKRAIAIKSLWLNLRLVVQVTGLRGIYKTLKREAKINQIRPKENKAYVWFIGVDPRFQHKAIGSELIGELVNRSVQMNLPLYLETSDIQNLSWYLSCGFEIYDQLSIGYTLFFLRRRPVQ